MRISMLLAAALLASACGPKCLKESCQVVETKCYEWVGQAGSQPLYMWMPCQRQQCTCIEREVEAEK
jgi:hypothetical protein